MKLSGGVFCKTPRPGFHIIPAGGRFVCKSSSSACSWEDRRLSPFASFEPSFTVAWVKADVQEASPQRLAANPRVGRNTDQGLAASLFPWQNHGLSIHGTADRAIGGIVFSWGMWRLFNLFTVRNLANSLNH